MEKISYNLIGVWILILIACIPTPCLSWEGKLKKGEVTELQKDVLELIDDVEGRDNLIALISYNAHPTFFKKCGKCSEIHSIMNLLAPAYGEQWRGEKHFRFINVQYTPVTQSLNKILGINPPAIIMLKPGEDPIPLDMISLRNKVKENEKLPEINDTAIQRDVLFPDFEIAKAKRKARRQQKLNPITNLVDEKEQWLHRLSVKTIVEWINVECDQTIDDIPELEDSPAAETAVGFQLSITQMMLVSVGFSSVLLLLYRAAYGPSPDPDKDEIQRFARVHSWFYLTFYHALFMGGMHWCVLVCVSLLSPHR